MRAINTLSTVGATTIALGDVEFLMAGQRVIIAGCDSVATATLTAKFAGSNVFEGPLPVEPSTDSIRYPDQILTQFIAGGNGQLTLTLGGTVAGARVNVFVLAPREPNPW